MASDAFELIQYVKIFTRNITFTLALNLQKRGVADPVSQDEIL